MIEVIAKLVTGPVYLGGESIECHVTFFNHLVPQHKTSQSNSDGLETLAWASAQINCQCSTNKKVVLDKKDSVTSEDSHSVSNSSLQNLNTSFAPCRGERGHVVYSTKPKILFCDLSLAPGESKTYIYREVLSSEAPPSYRGSAVMYSYKITIGMQRISSPIKQLQVPFRVLVVNGFPDSSVCGDSEDLAPSNPFLENEEKESPLDLALQSLQNITARRTPNFYNITNARGKVVRFCLFKNSYKLGEDIVGTFDFSESTVPCFQFSVTLQSEEEIPADNRVSGKQSCSISSYSKHHEVCLSLKYSQLILPIPLHVTPAFSTSVVKLRWRLHFKFVTAVSPIELQPKSDDTNNMWQGPSSLDIETMVWNHYVNIYPTAPAQVSQGVQAQTKYSITV